MTSSSTVYSGRMTNWPLIAAAVFFAGLLVIEGRVWRGPWPGMAVPLAIVVGLVILVVLTTSSQRVTTGPNGVLVRFGALGWPRFAYPPERIASAEVAQVSSWVVWSSGISWTRRYGLLLMLRSGPALHLVLTNGRRVTVGVDDAPAALAALRR